MLRGGRRAWATMLAAVVGSSLLWAAQPAGPARPDKDEPSLADGVPGRIKTVLDQLEKDADFDAATGKLGGLLAELGARADAGKVEPFVEAAFALRLVAQLGLSGSNADAVARLKFLRANDGLARAMAFAVRLGEEKPAEVYRVFDELRSKHADALARQANLTAAICVVFDRPLKRRLNENEVEAPGPADVFHYFAEHDGSLVFSVKKMPTELLIYMVDTTASIKEMEWALQRYKGDKVVGRRFGMIKYDDDHFYKGAEKKVTRAGYNLPNILKYGGVCIDQAYFAVAVGKAIGVPTTLARGAGGEGAHAWVGFFETGSRGADWNFRYGRYSSYQVVRGYVRDPQTGRVVADGHLSVLAELAGTSAADRRAAAALVEAARVLPVAKAPVPAAPDGAAPAGREIGVKGQLELLERALGIVPGHVPGWLLVGQLARSGAMTYEQKRYWANHLQKVCGRKYPDFSMLVLKPMIQTVEDTDKQNELWNACFKFFSYRKDLAAEIRMAQGAMWDKAGDDRNAGRCYEDVVERFVNDGPFVVEALKRTEAKLRDVGREKHICRLYGSAWAKCTKPYRGAPEWRKQSNWYRIGTMLAQRLADAGEEGKAREVQEEIARAIGAKR